MIRFPLPKALSEGQKLFRVGPIALDKRQAIILLGTLLGYTVVYKQLVRLVHLSPAQAAVIFAPVLVFAVVIAFVPYDGRHLDWWIQRKVSNMLKPRKLLWRHKPKGRKPLRDSIQEALPAETLYWETCRTRDGSYVMVFEIEPVALSLAGPEEQQRVWAATAQMYNQLDFPIIEITRSKRGNVAAYAQNLKDAISRSVTPGQTKLAQYARHHLRFLEQIVPIYNVYDRRSYIVLPYRPPNADTKSRHKRRPGVSDAVRLQKEAEEAYRVLVGRAQVIYGAVSTIGARVRLLTDVELLAFLKDEASSDELPAKKPPTVWEPVTMEVGGFGRLSDKRRAKVLEAVKKTRKKAPPAIGIGDLTLADKIAPDAARIHADYLRIGNRYHATVFLYELPPDIGFGDLQALLHIPGRVKVVKYVKPMPREKAVANMGGRVAELVAADATASDGNVIATQQRALARVTAEASMNQLMTGQESYFELTLLVHCEAESKERLSSLVQDVRTKIAGIRAESKLAREESWEGYVSCLPLGKNLLSKRYCAKPILTNPLACMFTFGSYEINHPDGVLYGINPYSGALIAIDNRELMNPHMTMLGTSGGGKSMAVKALSTRLRMRDHRVVLIDPVGDSKYGPVANAIGGQYVVFGLGTKHKFNPCQIDRNYMDISRLAAAEQAGENQEEARLQAQAAALDGKILKLTELVSLMVAGNEGTAGLTGQEQSLVDQLWYEVYESCGITRDPTTHHKTPPTFRDFFKLLAGKPRLEDLRDRLYPWESGAMRGVFDAQTNVDMDNKYLVLQIAGLEGRPKAAVMYALLEFLNSKLSNPDEISECFIDEFWSLLKYPMAADFCEQLWRSGRARNNAMIAVTQEVREFVGSDQGQNIMSLSASKMILRQQKKTIEILEEFHTFSESQKLQIQNARAGEGYIFIEENQIPLYVTVSEEEKRLFNTDPKKDREWRQQERENADRAARGRALPAPDSAGNAAAPTPLSPAAKARQIAAEDLGEIYVPDEEDYPVHEPEPAQVPAEVLAARAKLPSGDDPAVVCAVVGEGATMAAYNLAGLLARLGAESHTNVLFCDAQGDISDAFLGAALGTTPDSILLGSPTATVQDAVRRDNNSGLTVMAYPEEYEASPKHLIDGCRDEFHVIVVACGWGGYADGWLAQADVVVAAGQEAGELAASADRAETLRGHNGTLLATTGEVSLTPELMARQVYALIGASASGLPLPVDGGRFAALEDQDVGEAFFELVTALLDTPRTTENSTQNSQTKEKEQV